MEVRGQVKGLEEEIMHWTVDFFKGVIQQIQER